MEAPFYPTVCARYGIAVVTPNMEDRAWVHARPSNTEPIMRIIAEAPDRAEAEAKIAAVREVVDQALKMTR